MAKIPKGPPILGIALGPGKDEGGGDHEDHEDHDEKHRMVRELAEAFGVTLEPEQEEKACEALGAFIDEHDEEVDRKGEEDDEEGEDEEPMPRPGGRY